MNIAILFKLTCIEKYLYNNNKRKIIDNMFKDRKHTEESKQRISEGLKKYHANMTEEQKQERANKIRNTYEEAYQQLNCMYY